MFLALILELVCPHLTLSSISISYRLSNLFLSLVSHSLSLFVFLIILHLLSLLHPAILPNKVYRKTFVRTLSFFFIFSLSLQLFLILDIIGILDFRAILFLFFLFFFISTTASRERRKETTTTYTNQLGIWIPLLSLHRTACL